MGGEPAAPTMRPAIAAVAAGRVMPAGQDELGVRRLILIKVAEEAERIQATSAPAGAGRNYGEGFWMQQWLGLKRFAEALRS